MSPAEIAVHNYRLKKQNAAVCIHNYRKTRKHFYLVDAIDYTREALRLMRWIMKKGEYA